MQGNELEAMGTMRSVRASALQMELGHRGHFKDIETYAMGLFQGCAFDCDRSVSVMAHTNIGVHLNTNGMAENRQQATRSRGKGQTKKADSSLNSQTPRQFQAKRKFSPPKTHARSRMQRTKRESTRKRKEKGKRHKRGGPRHGQVTGHAHVCH
jgi:hypothetical protein